MRESWTEQRIDLVLASNIGSVAVGKRSQSSPLQNCKLFQHCGIPWIFPCLSARDAYMYKCRFSLLSPTWNWDQYVFDLVEATRSIAWTLARKFTLPSLHGMHSNFTLTYLGVVCIAERGMTLSDFDLGEMAAISNFKKHILHFSPKLFQYFNKMWQGHW